MTSHELRQVAERIVDLWHDKWCEEEVWNHDEANPELVKMIADALTAERVRTVEEVAKVICVGCREDVPVQFTKQGKVRMHIRPGTGEIRDRAAPCDADALHRRATPPGGS